ncbi:MAG: hypothetical protein N2663_01760 [Chlorobi bacterium]|nr:hypothetical protein [Chlorobiota bacterium]
MNVVKVGGSSLQDVSHFEQLAERLRREHPPPSLVVISALPGVTRRLEQAALLAQHGDLGAATLILQQILAQHIACVNALFGGTALAQALVKLIDEIGERTERLLRGVALTGVLTPRTLDRIVSTGERFVLHIVRHLLLERGLEAHAIAADELIVTDEQFGNACPLVDETAARVQQRLIPALEQGGYVITEGFVGATANGDVTTMGKESSSLTAALLASLVGARHLVFYTPVAGIFSADPLLVPTARPISQLSYDHAEHLAYAGLKLLYPTMIAPLRVHNTVLRVTALDAHSQQSTEITHTRNGHDVFVVMEEHLMLVQLDRSAFTQATECLWRYREVVAIEYGTVLVLAEPPHVLSLEQLGIVVRNSTPCRLLRVWGWSSSADFHTKLQQCVAALPQRRAMVVVQNGEESLLSAVTLSVAPQLLASLHDAIVENLVR